MASLLRRNHFVCIPFGSNKADGGNLFKASLMIRTMNVMRRNEAETMIRTLVTKIITNFSFDTHSQSAYRKQ
ncbi:MAG TPA: hypothetical protein PLP23_05900 [Panacibacter sp.]|nr:hypothetical protein [Panacibacter sp.]